MKQDATRSVECSDILERVPPIGTRKARGFASFSDGTSGPHEWEEKVYPPHPDGIAFRDFRVRHLGLSIFDTARRLGIRPSEVSDLEFGRAVPKHGWQWLRDLLVADPTKPRSAG